MVEPKDWSHDEDDDSIEDEEDAEWQEALEEAAKLQPTRELYVLKQQFRYAMYEDDARNSPEQSAGDVDSEDFRSFVQDFEWRQQRDPVTLLSHVEGWRMGYVEYTKRLLRSLNDIELDIKEAGESLDDEDDERQN